MIMFRIPIAQPPNPTRKSEAKGRNQCCRRLQMKAKEKLGIIKKLYAPAIGKMCQTIPNNQASKIPSHI